VRERRPAQPISTGYEAQMQAIPGRGYVIILFFVCFSGEQEIPNKNIHTQVGAFRKRESYTGTLYIF
jgi:hypothetical protein